MTNRIIFYHLWKWGFWIRMRGKGLCVRSILTDPLLFSERNGYIKGIRIGVIYLSFLPRAGG